MSAPSSFALSFRLLFRQISPGERNTSVSLTERIEERRRSQLAHVLNRDKVSLGARNARSVSRQKWHFPFERGGGTRQRNYFKDKERNLGRRRKSADGVAGARGSLHMKPERQQQSVALSGERGVTPLLPQRPYDCPAPFYNIRKEGREATQIKDLRRRRRQLRRKAKEVKARRP